MLPHPDTVSVLAAMDHRQALATAARVRRTAETHTSADTSSLLARARCYLVPALAVLGWSRRVSIGPAAVDVIPAVPPAH